MMGTMWWSLCDQRNKQLCIFNVFICNFFFTFFFKAPIPPGRDPRAVETRGPVAGQRVPVAGGMQGAPSHAIPSNAPPSARPVCLKSVSYYVY